MQRLPAVVLGAVLVLAACTGGGSGGAADASGTGTATGSASLLSGRPGRPDGPVVAVKVDNTARAHPQVGLDAADVVYVEQVEGGLTRLAALFSSEYPRAVGPVRSARISDLQLLRQYGTVALVYSGSQRAMVAPLRQSGLRLLSLADGARGFHRDPHRSAPYDVLADLTTLRGRAGAGVSTPTTVGYRFGPAPAGGRPASGVTVRWPAARLSAAWSASGHRWLVSMDGRAARTPDGGRLGPTTLVVQRVQVTDSPYKDVNRNPTPDSRTVGSGDAVVLRDGRVYDGRWSRPSPADPTTYTIAGRPAVLAAGQLWIALVGTSRPVSVR